MAMSERPGATPEDQDEDGRGPLVTVGAIVTGAAVIAALVALFVDPLVFRPMGRGMGPNHSMTPFLDIRLFLSTFNVLVLVALAWSYLAVYRDLPNRFTGSLLLFTVALLLYALASNPAVHLVFGYRIAPGLGPFAFLPDLFAAVAVTLLFYQSMQ
jgi:hypothetical protein